MRLNLVQQVILRALFVEPEDPQGWSKYKNRLRKAEIRKSNPRISRRGLSKNILGPDGKVLRPCSGCKQLLPIDQYHKTIKKNGAPRWPAMCGPCCLRETKNYYWRNPEKHRKARIMWARPKVNLITQIKNSTPCADCGKFFPAVCMDFDHRPGTCKVAGISEMAHGKYVELEKLEQEIEKCDVVCACCHRIRTSKRPHYRKKGGVKKTLEERGEV